MRCVYCYYSFSIQYCLAMSRMSGAVNSTVLTPEQTGGNKGRKVKCFKCGVPGHLEKYCWSSEGGTVFMGDLPPSVTEDWIRKLVVDFGSFSHIRIGSNIKDGGKWAMLSMETRAGGEAVIEGLHLKEVKGREIIVKWKEEGMWTCPDPTCAKSNFDVTEVCVQCKLPKSKFAAKLA